MYDDDHCSDGAVARLRRVQAATGMAFLGLLACAWRGTHALPLLLLVATSAGASSGSLLETRIALPVVPPPNVRQPGAFDESGCALISRLGAATRRICPARAVVPTTPGWSRHLGYAGPRVASRVGGTGVVLLTDTLDVAALGWWRATGLVRNDTAEHARDVMATVTLATANDWILGTATAVVPVRDVRPGEPAPFDLRTLVRAEAVRRIEWRVTATNGPGPAPTRDAEIEIGRISPALAGRITLPGRLLASEASAGGLEGSWIGWGVLRNWSADPLERPGVVGMWIDERGRAVRMVHGRVRRDGGGQIAVPPRGTRTFDLFEREPAARRGSGWRLALWQT